ncbi:MAG: VanZ family protein [Nitrospira sp.]|jgi:glycopeptide antibiotics resistance protein|nr:VanZ family protein [Nitrospira sp.]MDH4242880.1 VanZ family protein [Nitrospira sp.]MDH4357965.1 VanZ family protein [Nitrospira sp.]MDH5319714.1 VanZ family protein [Nitrospira sp.]
MDSKSPQKIALFTGLKQEKSTLIWFVILVLALAPMFPVSNFVGHSHWEQVRWIPFQGFSWSQNMLKDIITNTLWFMMFGYLLHYQLNWNSRFRWTIAAIITIAGGVSLSNELFQVFCHSRHPSMTDVACNIAGAGLGGYCAVKWPYEKCYGAVNSYFASRSGFS